MYAQQAQNKTNSDRKAVIIGAGAAGLMAAGSIRAKEVLVLERNEKPGKKLYITGKGRCNVTNDCAPSEFLQNVVHNAKFLYSSVYGFSPSDTCALLTHEGVPIKTERGNRVFPVSDKASDVIRALTARAERNGAQIVYNTRVKSVAAKNGGFRIVTDRAEYTCDVLLIATGGKSYPATGSTGDGYVWAEAFGHTLVSPCPSLVPLRTEEDVSALAGLTLKNVSVRLTSGTKTFTQFGELLFTHDGVSGPTVLRLSAYAARLPMPMRLQIDCKPALDADMLDRRITVDFGEFANKQLKNALDKLLPKALIGPIVRQSGVSADKKVHDITKEERRILGQAIKSLSFTVCAAGSFDTAVVTSGGLDTSEIDPKTMQSKIVPNLYFIGEVLDIDALTGGYNIQIALSTAMAAAKAVNKSIHGEEYYG